MQILGFEHLKELYPTDTEFREAYEAYQNPLLRNNNMWLDYNLQEGLLFKGGQLCIPNCSMRENIIQEKYSGGLAGQSRTVPQRCRGCGPRRPGAAVHAGRQGRDRWNDSVQP